MGAFVIEYLRPEINLKVTMFDEKGKGIETTRKLLWTVVSKSLGLFLHTVPVYLFLDAAAVFHCYARVLHTLTMSTTVTSRNDRSMKKCTFYSYTALREKDYIFCFKFNQFNKLVNKLLLQDEVYESASVRAGSTSLYDSVRQGGSTAALIESYQVV